MQASTSIDQFLLKVKKSWRLFVVSFFEKKKRVIPREMYLNMVF